MVEQRFKAVYSQRMEMCSKLGNIKPLIALVHEFAGMAIEEGSVAVVYIEKIQKELYDKGILPFEVKSIADDYKIGKLPFGDIRDFLHYVWLAYKHVEEDWQWDEEQHEYISREWRELETLKELQHKE